MKTRVDGVGRKLKFDKLNAIRRVVNTNCGYGIKRKKNLQ